ncbi:MAG: hypothetical protein V4787_11640 [Pseudomonadota bacterium]
MSGTYTLGRGKVYFDRFTDNINKVRTGERYIGNTPEISFSTEAELLEHFDADGGIRVKDDQVILEIVRTLTLTCDNIDDENLGLLFLGDVSTFTQASATGGTYNITDALQGRYYQIGQTAGNPQGVRGVTTVSIAGATLTDDYTLDAALGRIYIVPGGGITDGDDLVVTYTCTATERARIITADSVTIDGALRYISANPKGNQRDYYFPYVQLTPNGDYTFKGDEWQTLPFTCEVLKYDDSTAAVYIDGRPA